MTGLQKLLMWKAASGGGDGLPAEYQRVSYLQTSGYNARIDTGVSGNNEALEFDCDITTVVKVGYGCVFGNQYTDNYRGWRLMLGPSAAERYFFCSTYNRKAGSSMAVYVVPEGETLVGKRVRFLISIGRCTSETSDYSYTATADADTTQEISTRNIGIGAGHPGQSGASDLSFLIWRFKISESGTLIRDYIPCVRLSDSKAGFYDLVNKTFNPSIGSEDFTAGNV